MRNLILTSTLIAIALQLPLSAQNPRGVLRGTVQDVAGGRIPFAKLELRAADSSIRREAEAETNGDFRVEDLSPGTYRLTVTAPNFVSAEAEVVIAVSMVREVIVTLKPAGGKQTINVRGNVSSITTQDIDSSSAVRGGVVGTQDLETLPLPARSFTNIAYLVPGTEPVEPSDPTKARITAVSTGGSSGLNNELSVDGAENSDDWIGGFLQNFSPGAIQEFAVRTSNEDADTGWTTAGSVVVTTRRGSNERHGSASFFDRQAALNARFPIENPGQTCADGACIDNPKQPFSRQNFVGTIGGPLVTDRLWFFTSFEAVRENASIAYSPASITQFDALAQLASEGLIAGVPSITVPSTALIPFRDFLGSTRFDWEQRPKSSWFLRTSEDTYTTHNALVQQGTLPSTGLLTHNNYWNAVLGNVLSFNATWVGTLTADMSLLHLTQTRNSDLGFALAFPFSSTAKTVSGFETLGDNQFATPITLFPDRRDQQRYQVRYDITHVLGTHALRFGVDVIHEPVLGGAFASTAETLATYVSDPTYYAENPGTFGLFRPQCVGFSTTNEDNSTCTYTPASDGSFSQNVQRLAVYAEDSWRATRQLTVNYGLRYQTTWGLFLGSGRSEADNPAYLTLNALEIPIVPKLPKDYRLQIAPRLGFAYSPGYDGKTVFRGGFGLFYDDLAQNGWATEFEGVNDTNYATGPCSFTGNSLSGAGCLNGGAGATGNLIGAPYKTPYAIHITGGAEHSFNRSWLVSADFVHEQGNHGYRGFPYTSGTNLFTPLYPESGTADQTNLVPNVNVFESDNRSSYNALLMHLQGNMRGLDLVANYQLAKAQTWGCLLGELFDYVDGVCPSQYPNPPVLNPFGPGDYGPSGEDVRHRLLIAGVVHVPGGFVLSVVNQFESARPFTITNASNTDRIYVQLSGQNPSYSSLDMFRAAPYMQSDLRVARPFTIHDRWHLEPFIEFFNLFNRNNPGANYAANVAQLPIPQSETIPNGYGQTIVSSVCLGDNASNCTTANAVPLTGLKQLEIPEGALGDFFGPGTTVGIPFAAQIGVYGSF